MGFALRHHFGKTFRDHSLLVVILAAGLASASTATLLVLIDSLVLRPIRTPHLDRVVTMAGLSFGDGMPFPIDWWGQATSLEALAMYDVGDVLLESPSGARWIRAAAVSSEFFDVLPQPLLVGAPFLHDEDDRAVLISEALWRSAFGGASNIPQATVRLDNSVFRVSGVISSGFDYPGGTSVWLPSNRSGASPLGFVQGATELPVMRRSAGFVGRLRGGHTVEQLQAQLQVLLERANRELSPKTGMAYGDTVGVRRLAEAMSRDYATTLRTMFFASLFALLITTSNLGLALAVRLAKHSHEIEVRRWMGASTMHLAQLHAGWLATILGCSIAIAAALSWAFLWLAEYSLPSLSIHMEFSPGLPWLAAAAAAAITALIAVLAGVVAFLFYRFTLGDDKVASRANPFSGVSRRAFISVQVAAAFVLVVGCVVSLRELQGLISHEYGYDPNGLVAAQASYTWEKPSAERLADWRSQLVAAARQGGAAEVSLVNTLPVYLRDKRRMEVLVGDVRTMATIIDATETYLDVLRVPLAAGRKPITPDEVLINEAFAKSNFGATEGLGRLIRISGSDSPSHIVGVYGTLRTADQPTELLPEIVRPFGVAAVTGRRTPSIYVLAACQQRCHEVSASLLRSLQVVPSTTITRVDQLGHLARLATASSRGRALVWLSYAAVGMVIAIAGVAALVAFTVSARRFEAQVRMALGASPQAICLLMAREGIIASLVGLTIGVSLATLGVTAIQKLVIDLVPPSTGTLAIVALIFFLVSCTAAVVPALKSTRFEGRMLLKDP